jgi:hypothetical protein
VSEHFDFEVIPSDDPTVRDADKGFLVEVAWTVTAPEGGKAHGVRRVLVPSTADAIVQLGSLYEPTEIPAVTAQRIISGGTASTPLYDIRIRHDDTAGWAAEDPILSLGEEGIDVDTGTRKVGDGVTTWSSLPDRLSDEADARAAADAALDIRVDALEVAPPAHTHPLADVTDAGTAAAADVGDFATAAQGTLADSASQPGHAHAGADITSGTVAYARLPVGTAASTLAAGDDSRITGAAQKSANLSDLANASTARTNLGLGDSAVVGALPIPDPGSFYPTDTITAALQLIGGREVYGTGSPEGVVTAAVGTYYTDTAITNGALRWAKKTGSGNTGWVCIEGDTGWRDIAASTGSEATAMLSRLRRSGSTITYYGRFRPAGAAIGRSKLTQLVGIIPVIYTGFAPPSNDYGPRGLSQYGNAAGTLTSSAVWNRLDLYPGATLAGTWIGTEDIFVRGQWDTTDAWPTTLPGTAA